MKKTTLFLILFLLKCVFCSSQSKVTEKDQLKLFNSIFDKYIAVYLTQENDPHLSEYSKVREFYLYDVDDDERKDLIVIYTLEGAGGGNNWRRCLSIFPNKPHGFEILEGITLFGNIAKYDNGKLIGFEGGYIMYELKKYNYNSKSTETILVGITIRNNSIVSTKPI